MGNWADAVEEAFCALSPLGGNRGVTQPIAPAWGPLYSASSMGREARMGEAGVQRGLSRRAFVQGAGLAGLGLLAECGRLPGQTQPPLKLPRIGYLLGVPPVAAVLSASDPRTQPAAAFREGLREHGWVEG